MDTEGGGWGLVGYEKAAQSCRPCQGGSRAADAEMLSLQVVSSLIKSAHPHSCLGEARTHTQTHSHTQPRSPTLTHSDMAVVKGLSKPPLRAVSEVKRESAAPCSRIYC